MDHILQRVVGASPLSPLNGYSGYNQVLVHEDDQYKIKLTTPWGTFKYAKMPFGLKNVGATFQRAMDIAFLDEKDVLMVVYLDDITMFSHSDDEHLHHLRVIFQKCRKCGISLNPKKSMFAMEEGKLLAASFQEMASGLILHEIKPFNKFISLAAKRKSKHSMVG